MRAAVIGAGLSGLAAASALARAGYDVEVFESQPYIGGLAGTFFEDGFIRDLGPHFLPRPMAEEIGFDNECVGVPYVEKVGWRGELLPFPLGLMRKPRYLFSGAAAYLRNLGSNRSGTSVAEHIEASLGRTLAREVAGPLIKKWSGCELHDLDAEWAWRIPRPSIQTVLRKSWYTARGTQSSYVYPRGGAIVASQRLAKGFEDRIHLSCPVERIVITNGRVRSVAASGREWACDAVVYSGPVTELFRLTGADCFRDYRQFRYRPVVLLFLRLNRALVTHEILTYVPDESLPFYRVSELKAVFPPAAPPDKTMVTVEIGCERGDAVWNTTAADLARQVLGHLSTMYGVRQDDLAGASVTRIEYGYPLYMRSYTRLRTGLRPRTPVGNLFLTGRQGLFRYIVMDGAYHSGLETAAEVIASTGGKLGS